MSHLMGKAKCFEKIVYLHSQSQRFFANVSYNFSNSNYGCMTFARVSSILSFMQWVEEYLVALKDFNFVFPFAFENEHQFENNFALIM